jgi:hypothetical protein
MKIVSKIDSHIFAGSDLEICTWRFAGSAGSPELTKHVRLPFRPFDSRILFLCGALKKKSLQWHIWEVVSYVNFNVKIMTHYCALPHSPYILQQGTV